MIPTLRIRCFSFFYSGVFVYWFYLNETLNKDNSFIIIAKHACFDWILWRRLSNHDHGTEATIASFNVNFQLDVKKIQERGNQTSTHLLNFVLIYHQESYLNLDIYETNSTECGSFFRLKSGKLSIFYLS